MNRAAYATLGAAAVALLVVQKVNAQRLNADDPATEDTSDVTNTIGAPTNVTPGARALAIAIATAEGFFTAGTIPARAHNPGDLVIPGWTGPTLGDQAISVFASDSDGWNHLYHQLDLIARGRSHVYTLDDSIFEMADKWTASHADDWSANVVASLRTQGFDWIDESTALREVIA